MIGLIVELLTASMLPVALVLSYIYVAAMKGLIEKGKNKNLTLFLGVILLWIAAVMGPITFVGAFLVSIAFILLSWVSDVKRLLRVQRLFKKLRLVREEFRRGCTTTMGCLLRFVALWPALASIAVSTYVVVAPIVMFIVGYLLKPRSSFKGRLEPLNNIIALGVVLVAWFYAITNTIKNVLLPRWLLLQNYALSGEVSKMPITARLLAKYLGREAAYIYLALLIALALYTVVRIHQVIPKSNVKYSVVLIAPFLGYAVASNKLGEPITSVAYALGITLSVFVAPRFRAFEKGGSKLIERAFRVMDVVAKRLLDFDVPMGPLRRLLT